jgi:hypothetical protein
MSKRHSWAALPAVALTTLSVLAAGCAAASSGSAGAAGAGSPSTGPAGSGAGGSAPGGTGSPSPVPTITATGAPAAGESACSNWPADAPRGRLPLTFTPVEVLRCVTSVKDVPGKGLFLAGTLERSTSGIARLVAALRRPSTHVPTGTMCPMIAMLPPEIVLVARDGSMLTPTIPVVGCGVIDSPVLAALNAMPWQVLSVRLSPDQPGGTSAGTAPAGSTAGQNPVDPVPGQVKGTPQVS